MRASRAAILIAATSACAPAPDPLRGGPPPALAWVRAVVVAEHDAYALLETTAPPGLSVRVWWSGATTTACGAGVPGACLGLSAPQVWGTGGVGADGRAWVIRPAEPPAYGNLWLQADISVPGRAPLLSATFAALRQEATSDMDGDGLRAGQEVDARLDPRLPDTDGGGSGDLQELSVDHTDPLARGDDLAGERACHDGVDDDGDGRVDCADADCPCPAEVCGDGVDNDADGLVDCEDAACFDQAGCAEQGCADGLDDDHDGAVDCDDEDCWSAACHDAVLAWTVAGATRGVEATSSFLPTYGSRSSVASAVIGRVRVEDGGVAQTCAWTVSRARLWQGTRWVQTSSPGGQVYSTFQAVQESSRQGVWFDPACRVGVDVLPALAAGWSRWYGAWAVERQSARPNTTWAWSGGPYVVWRAEGGPALPGEPHGACLNGKAPTLAWSDLDGDGFGVEGLDLHGRPGGRVWSCDLPGPGLATQPGDCDDGDALINPVDVALAAGRTCADARPWDVDGDGRATAVDADDRDGAAW